MMSEMYIAICIGKNVDGVNTFMTVDMFDCEQSQNKPNEEQGLCDSGFPTKINETMKHLLQVRDIPCPAISPDNEEQNPVDLHNLLLSTS